MSETEHQAGEALSAEAAPAGVMAAKMLLDQLRAEGVDRLNPVRFSYLAALLRRAEAQPAAAARALILQRVEQVGASLRPGGVLHEDVSRLAAPSESSVRPRVNAAVPQDQSRLAALLTHLAEAGLALERVAEGGGFELAGPAAAHADPQPPAVGAVTVLAPATPAGTPPPGSLKSVRHFRRTWKRLNAEQRLAQSRAALPLNAGPLNSHHLVHRALQQLRDLSPAYFERFVAQVDGLLWLEQAVGEPGKEPASGSGRARR